MFRRLRQLALTLAAIVSVVMLPIIAITWVTSHDRHDMPAWMQAYGRNPSDEWGLFASGPDGSVGIIVVSVDGEIGIFAGRPPSPGHAGVEITRDRVLAGSKQESHGWRWRSFGFGCNYEIFANVKPLGNFEVLRNTVSVIFPHWFAALLCVPAPVLWWRRRRRAMRQSVELCPVCNYDLRGTPGRCPECGWKQDGVMAAK